MLDIAERNDRERGDRGDDHDRGRERHQEGHARARIERLLAQQLQDVGERLKQSVRTDAVGPVAVLKAAEELALEQQDHRHDAEHESEYHDRLDDLDPRRLDESGVRDRETHPSPNPAGGLPPDGSISTTTGSPSYSTFAPSSVPSIRYAMPRVAASRIRTAASTALP